MKGFKLFLSSALINLLSGKQWLKLFSSSPEPSQKAQPKTEGLYIKIFRCQCLHNIIAKTKKQVEKFSTSLTFNGIFAFTLLYYFFLFLKIHEINFRVTLILAMLVSLIIYFKNGYVNLNSDQLSKIEQTNAKLESIDSSLKNKPCEICQIPKLLRTYHCDLCDRCVHMPIAHSLALNSCITASNNMYYIIYLILNIYLIVLFLTLYNGFLLLQFFNWFLLVNMSIEVVEHLAVIANNLTPMELIEPFAHSYLKVVKLRDTFLFNPFDKGIIRNFQEFCKRNFRIQTAKDKVEEEINSLIITSNNLELDPEIPSRLTPSAVAFHDSDEEKQHKSGKSESTQADFQDSKHKEDMLLFLRGLARDYTREYFDPERARLVSLLQISCPSQRFLQEKLERIVIHQAREF